MPTWQKHGDVVLVSYTGKRFDSKSIVETVATWINQHRSDYDEVVFIGSSMGGLLAYDTAISMSRYRMRLTLIIIDAPTKRSDFQSPLDTVSGLTWIWWAGPISNLASKLYFNATFRGPAEHNIEPGVDRKELAKRVAEAKSFPLSIYADWIRYIIGHKPLIKGSLAGYDVVYIRSQRDTDTVRPRAYESWCRAFGGSMLRIEVDSTHAGYNERPTSWIRGFEDAFLNLEIR